MKDKKVIKKEKARVRELTIKKTDPLFVTQGGKKIELKVVDNKVKLIK